MAATAGQPSAEAGRLAQSATLFKLEGMHAAPPVAANRQIMVHDLQAKVQSFKAARVAAAPQRQKPADGLDTNLGGDRFGRLSA